jgi:hypothetical protein
MLFIALIPACRKSDEAPGNPGDPGDSTNLSADLISNHLLLTNASKKPGGIPTGPGGSSLKISFKDTLYLFDEIKRPIKFLHLDTSKNVSGLYIQVSASSGGGTASHYYDVPELEDVADSDTVSVIMVGIDPEGLPLPQTYDVTIVPYDKNKQPIAEIIKPLRIDYPKKQTPGNAGSCGLDLPTNEFWAWELSIAVGPGLPFYNDPFTIHSAQGQRIEGSCCAGKSRWPEFCIGQLHHNNSLHFATYYQIKQETFTFFSGGRFFRLTDEDSPVPVPAESDFCGSGSGKVLPGEKLTTYEGDWKIVPAKITVNTSSLIKNDSLELILIHTSSTGTGYGNPGGVIHQLDCELGALVLIQTDREGGGRHLVKVYSRRKIGDPSWYNIN